MTTFTIDSENNIMAFGSPEEAAATTVTPFDTFASQKELMKNARCPLRRRKMASPGQSASKRTSCGACSLLVSCTGSRS
jgi:hypothetical protein